MELLAGHKAVSVGKSAYEYLEICYSAAFFPAGQLGDFSRSRMGWVQDDVRNIGGMANRVIAVQASVQVQGI